MEGILRFFKSWNKGPANPSDAVGSPGKYEIQTLFETIEKILGLKKQSFHRLKILRS